MSSKLSTMHECPHCGKKAVSEHFMRCISCYAPITIDEMKEIKRKAKK